MERRKILIIPLSFFIFLLVLMIITIISGNNYTQISKNSNYSCNCTPAATEECFQALNFFTSSHYIHLCGIKNMYSKISVRTKDDLVRFNHTELELMDTFLDQCFEHSSRCHTFDVSQVIQSEVYREDCQFYTGIKNILSVCFNANRELSKGFINRTVFNQKELYYLYQIIKFFALEEWTEIKSINSHLPYRPAQYEKNEENYT